MGAGREGRKANQRTVSSIKCKRDKSSYPRVSSWGIPETNLRHWFSRMKGTLKQVPNCPIYMNQRLSRARGDAVPPSFMAQRSIFTGISFQDRTS